MVPRHAYRGMNEAHRGAIGHAARATRRASAWIAGFALVTVAPLASGDEPPPATEEGTPETLSSAYNELAVEKFRLNDLAGAEEQFHRSLALIEERRGISSPLLVAPLAGLAAVRATRGLHASAVELLGRAIMVRRRDDGLFTTAQLPLIESLVASYAELGDWAQVLGARQYALAISEQNYGILDPRNVAPVRQLAELHESLGDYPRARILYERMRRIGAQEGGHGNATVVAALIAIGRCHRRQFVEAPRSVQPERARDPVSGDYFPLMSLEPYQGPKPNRAGPRATAEAIDLLRRANEPPPALLAQAQIEMGDWNLVLRRSAAAIQDYTEACEIRARALTGESDPLASPRLVFYRAPAAARRSASLSGESILVERARYRLTVEVDGSARDIILDQSTTSARRADLLRRSLESARYSPRFESCKPVATMEVVFEGYWEALAG